MTETNTDTAKLFTADDGATIGYRVFGSGNRVVTGLHSLALDGTWYEPLAEALGEQYTVIAPDFRAHGASERGDQPPSLQRVAEDIRAIWQAESVSSGAVMGISLGGMIAQVLAGLYPQHINGQILMATRGAYDDKARQTITSRAEAIRTPQGHQQVEDDTIYRWFGEASKDPNHQLATKAREQYRATGGEALADYFIAMPTVGDFIQATSPTTMVIGGANDLSTPATALEELAASIEGAQLEFVRGGHLVAFENPQEVATAVLPFLNSLHWDR